MMLHPDQYFNRHCFYFPAINRAKARVLFRRAIRQFYAMQRKFVVDPETQKKVDRVFVGAVIQSQKRQRRLVKRYFKGASRAGRPTRPEIVFLVSKLFILWGRYAKSPTTCSWKKPLATQTDFEAFVHDLLPRLGAKDVRRYLENHWRLRK